MGWTSGDIDKDFDGFDDSYEIQGKVYKSFKSHPCKY